MKKEMVNHPSHYNVGKFEVIDVIEDWNLGFCLGNAVKYIARAGHKDANKTIEDLSKAIWYIDRYIQEVENNNKSVCDTCTKSCGCCSDCEHNEDYNSEAINDR